MKEHSPWMSSHYHKTQPRTLRDAAPFLQLGWWCVCTSLPLGRLWVVLQCAVQEGMGWGVGRRVMCDASLAPLPGRQQGRRKGSCASALMGSRDSACFLTRAIMWQRQRMDSTRTYLFPCSSLQHTDNVHLQPHPPSPGPIPPQCQCMSLTAPGFYILQSS